MVKAKILAIVVVGALLLMALAPGTAGVAVASQPNQPVNTSPDDGTVDIMTSAYMFSWTYSDPDGHARFANCSKNSWRQGIDSARFWRQGKADGQLQQPG